MNICPEPMKSMKPPVPSASLFDPWTEGESLDELFDRLGWIGVERLHISTTACLPAGMLVDVAWTERIRWFHPDDLDSVALVATPDDIIWFDPVRYGTFLQAGSATILSGLCKARLIADLTATSVLPAQMPSWLGAATISATNHDGEWRYLAIAAKGVATPSLHAEERGRVSANIARWMRRSLAVKTVLYPQIGMRPVTLWSAIAAHAPKPVRLSLVLKDACPLLIPPDFAANRALLVRAAGRGQFSSVELIPHGDRNAHPLIHFHLGEEDEDVIWDDIDRVFYRLELQCNTHKHIPGRDLYADQAQ